jgi:hypothetical protein
MKEKKKKKKYEKPKVIYRKEIETLAAYCDSAGCRLTLPSCTRTIT